MSGYVWSRIFLFSHAEVLAFAAIAVSLIGLAAAALSYLGHYATPERVRIRPWAPVPDDLPDRPSHLRVMYGATDLKARYRSFMLEGVSSSTFLHAVIIGALLIAAALSTTSEEKFGRPVIIPILPTMERNPISQKVEPEGVSWGKQGSIPRPSVPTLSRPVPVPETRENLLTIFDPTSLSVPGPIGEGIWNEPLGIPGKPGGPTSEAAPAVTEDITDFVFVEKMPVLVSIEDPVYPQLAIVQQLKGDIKVRALVGTDGRVKDVRLVNSIPILDESAKAAARTGIFKPAYWNNQPVAVWVEFTIKFQLR